MKADMSGKVLIYGFPRDFSVAEHDHPLRDLGHFRVMRDGDNTKNYYEALWCRKVKFRLPSEETRTKEGTIQWRTPTMEGTGAGLFVDSGDHAKYIKHKTFDTASAAKAWLDELAHVSAVTT